MTKPYRCINLSSIYSCICIYCWHPQSNNQQRWKNL